MDITVINIKVSNSTFYDLSTLFVGDFIRNVQTVERLFMGLTVAV